MEARDRLMIELMVMDLVSYQHALAVIISPKNRPDIDATWEAYKKSLAEKFAYWDNLFKEET